MNVIDTILNKYIVDIPVNAMNHVKQQTLSEQMTQRSHDGCLCYNTRRTMYKKAQVVCKSGTNHS